MRYTKRTILLLATLMLSMSINAQDIHDDFQSFRSSILSNYQSFRNEVLSNYASFLDGAWQEMKVFRGQERDKAPKPTVAPKAEPSPTPTAPVVQQPKAESTPAQPITTPQPPVTPQPPSPPQPITDYVKVSFYTAQLVMPKPSVKSLTTISNDDFGNAWRDMARAKVESVIPHLRNACQAHGLNDWFMLQFIGEYAKAVVPNNLNAQTALCHYLMAHLGYDVRLARAGNRSCLLLNFSQRVYSVHFVELSGKNYYVWQVPGADIDFNNTSISTCQLPEDSNLGQQLDLRLTAPLLMPDNQIPFQISHGGITLSGQLNKTVMEMVRHYPQMPVTSYAQSVLDADMRRSLVSQMRQALAGKSQYEAVNLLLHFVQSAFEYATDQQQHGYEKPYFVEEVFYYPQCDCEDRAVLFAYLLREALNADNVLVRYPGHECTAVSLAQPIRGDGFTWRGQGYYIADPTYIGSNVGDCMPDYRDLQPEVEAW